jgi:hypothetical protein
MAVRLNAGFTGKSFHVAARQAKLENISNEEENEGTQTQKMHRGPRVQWKKKKSN